MSEDRKYSKNKCVVPNCTDRFSSRFRFPNPRYEHLIKITREWIERINNPALFNLSYEVIYNKYRVCRRHFTGKDQLRGCRKGIKSNAVPTLFLPESK